MLKYPLIFALLTVFLLAVGGSAQTFTSELNGARQTPPNNSQAVGVGSIVLNGAETNITVTLYFSNLGGAQTNAEIDSANGAVFSLPPGNFSRNFPVTAAQAAELKSGAWSFSVGSANFPNGEIGGRINAVSSPNAAPFPFSGGLPDASFDVDGIVTTDINNGENSAQAVAVQPDGKIIVAGYARNSLNNDDFAAVRYNPNGSPDPTFGNGGIALTPIGAGDEQAFAVAVQPDGKILLAGYSFVGATTDAAVIRLNSNGTPDSTFSDDGMMTVPIGVKNDFLRSIVLQTDGKIVLAGIRYNTSTSDFAVLRLNSDGTPDADFDGDSGAGDGIVTTVLGSGYSYGYAAAVQPDGKILVAGYYFNGANNNDSAIVRYNSNGTLDTTFDGDGIAGTVIGVGTDEAFGIALQNDGKIVIAGCVNRGGGNDFLLARYSPNGSPDANFGANGATITPVGNGVDIAQSVAIQADGKIVAAGFSSNGANYDFAVIRRNADGTLDAAFDGDGKMTTPIGISTDTANGLAIQADGKIVVVGRTVAGSFADFAVVRYGYGTNAQTNDGFISLNAETEVRFENAFRAGTTFSEVLNSPAVPPLPANFNLLTSPRVVQTSAGFSGEILVKFKLPVRVSAANFNAAQVLHYENGAWIDRTTAAPPRDFETRTIYARVLAAPGVFAVVSPLAQTPEYVSISGRILSADGRPAAGAIISQTASNGETRSAIANQFGYYRFPQTALRETYVIKIVSKRHRFSPRILTVGDELTNLNFTSG